jgi:hypothetical protein
MKRPRSPAYPLTDLLRVRPDPQTERLHLEPGPSFAEFNAQKGRQYIVCIPVTLAPAVASTVGQCTQCQADVWVAPSTRQAMTQIREPRLLCLDCMVAQVEAEPRRAD